MKALDVIQADPALDELARRTTVPGAAVTCRGAAGSSTVLVAGALHRRTDRPVLLALAHLDEADAALETLEAAGIDAARLPALEVAPGETKVHPELQAERLRLARRLASAGGEREPGSAGGDDGPPGVLVAPIAALMQPLPPPERVARMVRVVRPGDEVDTAELAAWLAKAGWARVDAIESPGEFAVRGDILDLFPPGGEPVRIDLFGDEVERLFAVDLDTMASDRRLDRVELLGATDAPGGSDAEQASLADALPAGTIVVLAEIVELGEQGRSYFERVHAGFGIEPVHEVFRRLGEDGRTVVDVNQFGSGLDPEHAIDLPVEPLPIFDEHAPKAVAELGGLAKDRAVVACCTKRAEADRLGELLASHAPDADVEVEVGYVHRGFGWGNPRTGPRAARPWIVPHHELMHRYGTRRRVFARRGERALDAFVDLQPGDHVVHRDHGIAVYRGLRTLDPRERPGAPAGAGRGKRAETEGEEFIVLEFARGTVLNVPAAKAELVQKYIGGFAGKPELSTFGGKRWKTQKEKVGDAVRELAAEMLRMQAVREALPGIAFPRDTAWQNEFEAEFPYDETEDQLAAIAAVKEDMHAPRPMDRLVCGDVGFGKTEVAIRAAFKAVESGRQVAVLVPTTVLAEQHGRTFRERFRDYPFRIEALSRFRSTQDARAILKDVAAGRVDVLIGTHRILSKDVRFADLGLVVVDEEQRFGVEHKQRLLRLRTQADVLTLTATPIPRTLHMSLLGLRDISALQTAPADRRAIVTEVIPWNEERLRQALERELAREGQIFVVHNRVHDLDDVAERIRRLVPDATIVTGHGQMAPASLEKVMLRFIRGEADVLVSTTIIESGIDIPRANTMIVSDAHRYGLSELHQLRGRVGRHRHRAYCYLILPRDKPASEVAIKRLRALESFSMLGSGFRIALKDLELRGAGNLLGAEQSGHIAVVGYEMYCQLLEQAVDDLKQERKTRSFDTNVDLNVPAGLPPGYVPAAARRLDAYRRISRAGTTKELARVRRDLESAYGELPAKAQTLFELTEIRIAAAAMGVRAVTLQAPDVVVRTGRPDLLVAAFEGVQGSVRPVGEPDADGVKAVHFRPPAAYLEPSSLLPVLRHRLQAGAKQARREEAARRAKRAERDKRAAAVEAADIVSGGEA